MDAAGSQIGNDNLISLDRLGRFQFQQPKQGYRFSIDSVLLSAFATPSHGAVADLGAGCGVLCVLLAAYGSSGPFSAVEIDPLAARCSKANFQSNGLQGRVIQADITNELSELQNHGFSLVVSNPPFTKSGHGRISPDHSRARARQELAMEADDLWTMASRLLKQGGRMACCWPPARLVEALCGLEAARLTPKRLRLVYGRNGRPASLALIEAVKDGGKQLDVEPPLLVYDQGRQYSAEVRDIYQSLEPPSEG